MRTIKAWHFTGDTLRDGQPIPPVGKWLVHEGSVSLCVRGLHASRKLLDACEYAPAAMLHRVECGDIVEKDESKFVCRQRRILATIPAARMEQILRLFARLCAYTQIDKWDAPEIVRRWLETGDESIRAAEWDAARDAAMAAARDAARDAAWDAAMDAARAAARDAARAAARAAAWDAARAAEWDAARAALNGELEHMVLAEMGLKK